jgi:HAD superfamily hydrolase (TIGR01484 family)
MIRLVVTDLDATIVNQHGEVSERTRSALLACQAAGLHICVATGRVRPAVIDVGQEFTICQGGTLVLEGQQHLFRSSISQADALAVWHWAERHQKKARFYGEYEWSSTYADEATHALTRWMGLVPHGEPQWDVPLIAMEGDGSDVAVAFPHLHVETQGEGTAAYVRSTPCDKGTGLRTLMVRLGLAPHEVICFGDELNDLPMFTVAGQAVAMGNARPELKALATSLAPTIDEDGVAQVLEQLLRTHT